MNAFDQSASTKRSKKGEPKSTIATILVTLTAVSNYFNWNQGAYPKEGKDLYPAEGAEKLTAMCDQAALVKTKERHKTSKNLDDDLRQSVAFHRDIFRPRMEYMAYEIARKDYEIARKNEEIVHKDRVIYSLRCQMQEQMRQGQHGFVEREDANAGTDSTRHLHG
jgi:hypothetical protein